MIEQVKSVFEYDVTGIPKIKDASAAIDRLHTAGDKVGKQTSSLAGLQQVGGEKMARYATAAGMLTGQMQRLGIQNELVARGFQIGTEALTGMLGPIGLAVIGIGALGVVVMDLAGSQKRLREETLQTTNAIIAQANARKQPLTGASASTGQRELTSLMIEEQSLLGQMAGVSSLRASRMGAGSSRNLSGSTFSRIQGGGGGTLDPVVLEQQYNKLALRLGEVRDRARDVASALGITTPKPGTPEAAGAAGAAGTPSGWGSGFGPVQYDLSGTGPMSPSPANRIATTKALEDFGEKATDSGTKWADAGIEAAKRWEVAVISSGQRAYGAMAKEATKYNTLSQVMHLQGLRMFTMMAREEAAAYIQAQGEKSAIDMVREAAAAISAAAYGNFGAAAGHAVAAAKYGAIAVGAAVAANVVRGDQGSAGSAMTSDYSSSTATGSSAGSSSSGRSGYSLQSASAAPQTVNYYANLTIMGNAVYGADGFREMFAQHMVPLMREFAEAGYFSKN